MSSISGARRLQRLSRSRCGGFKAVLGDEGGVGDVEDGLEGVGEELGGVGEVFFGGGELAGAAVAVGGADAEVPEFLDEGLEGFFGKLEKGLASDGGGFLDGHGAEGDAVLGDGDASVWRADVGVDVVVEAAAGVVGDDGELEGSVHEFGDWEKWSG